jgi:polysaccharide biosynthesis/export protein
VPQLRLGVLRNLFYPLALIAALEAARPVSAQVVGESPQQANQRIQELSKTIHFAPHDYLIGSGDVLNIEVFDVKELSREVRVSQSGTIGLPLVPVRLEVAGLTEMQAQRKIAEVLEANGLVSHPEVTVTVKDHRSKPITVVGAVMHPMVYQADGPVTLLEVLAEAGGISNDAGDTVIVTRPVRASDAPAGREPESAPGEPPPIAGVPDPPGDPAKALNPPASPGQSVPEQSVPEQKDAAAGKAEGQTPSHPTNAITVNLNELVEKGDASNNIPLEAGDVVTVPHAGIVYVLGAVGKPGGFVLANDRSQMTALKMLALAGGLTQTAKSSSAVVLRRDTDGKQREVALDLKRIQKREMEDIALFPSDIVYVPESAAKSTLIRAASIGIAIGTGVALYRLAYH